MTALSRILKLAWPHVLISVVVITAVADYANRSARVITADDPAELQVVAMAGGIPHGTSYPLYISLLHFFTRLPVGSFAFRCNLFSAICAGVALGAAAMCSGLISIRGGRKRYLAGAIAAAILARSFTMTRVSIFTGMYTLHLAMALAAIALVIRWLRIGDDRDIKWAMGLLGAMLGNHIMTIALYPGVLLILFVTVIRDRSKLRGIVHGFGLGVLGVLVANVALFYLLWLNRVSFDHWSGIVDNPKFFDIDPVRAQGFGYAWWYETTCRQFRFDILGADWAQRVSQLRAVIPGMEAELSPAAVALSALGLVVAFRENRRVALLLVVVAATHVVLATGYTATVKINIYLLPVSAIAAILAGTGTWAIVRALRAVARKRLVRGSWAARAVPFVVLVTFYAADASSRSWLKEAAASEEDPTVRNAVATRMADRPDERTEKTMYLLAQKVARGLPPDAIVFADWSQIFAIHYVLRVERKITGVTIYDPYPYGIGRREFPVDHIERITAAGRVRPVYFVSPSRPPSIPGFKLVTRTAELSELVRVDANP